MTLINVPLERILPNPWQTGGYGNEEYIAELAADIHANGLLQRPQARLVDQSGAVFNVLDLNFNALFEGDSPVFVQLAFGHNRFAAYQKLLSDGDAYFATMPAELRELTDIEMADIAWAENERRRGKSPIEKAKGIQKRIDDFGWTHEQASEHLRISRSAVTNALRLLKLPEDVQSRLNDGLPERTALALLSLFDLPEAFRQTAEGQSEYNWDYHSGETKPSKIIADALAGESSERIRQRIDELIKKFGERLSGAPWKYADNFNLLLMGIGLPENLSLTALQSPACSDCPLRQENHICLDKHCYHIKVDMWKIYVLHRASQASNIPYLIPEEESRYPRSYFNEYNARQYAQAIISAGCENLRLVYRMKSDRKDVDDLDGQPWARIVCQKRTGSCSCLQGHQAKTRAAAASPAPQNGEAGQAQLDEAQPQGKTLTEVFDAADLEEAAREARRERKASLELIPDIQDQAIEIVTGELAGFNLKLWQDIIGRVYYDSAKELSSKEIGFNQIANVLAQALVKRETPSNDYFRGVEDPAGYVRRVLNRYLADKECPVLSDEPEQKKGEAI